MEEWVTGVVEQAGFYIPSRINAGNMSRATDYRNLLTNETFIQKNLELVSIFLENSEFAHPLFFKLSGRMHTV